MNFYKFTFWFGLGWIVALLFCHIAHGADNFEDYHKQILILNKPITLGGLYLELEDQPKILAKLSIKMPPAPKLKTRRLEKVNKVNFEPLESPSISIIGFLQELRKKQ